MAIVDCDGYLPVLHKHHSALLYTLLLLLSCWTIKDRPLHKSNHGSKRGEGQAHNIRGDEYAATHGEKGEALLVAEGRMELVTGSLTDPTVWFCWCCDATVVHTRTDSPQHKWPSGPDWPQHRESEASATQQKVAIAGVGQTTARNSIGRRL